MTNARDKIDLDSYVQARVDIKNSAGGRGYHEGVRTFDCPWCDDSKGRGWLNVDRGTAGCFNAGCPASPRIDGGAMEWARAAEGFVTIGKTLAYLRANFPATKVTIPPKPREAYQDFCRFPNYARNFAVNGSLLQKTFEIFAKERWGLSVQHLINAGAKWCVEKRYAWRIVFPILMNKEPVGFQARTIKSAEPKYLTSIHGTPEDVGAECGRPAEAMLYGIDDIEKGDQVVLVEGIADRLASLYRLELLSVALLGPHCTQEKLSLLKKAEPGKVIVALDAEEEEAGLEIVRDLLSWGIDSSLGTWVGGKDPGAGGILTARGLGLTEIARKLKT